MHRPLLFAIAAANVAAEQIRLAPPDHHVFEWPIQDVAIVGAGASGLLSYRELLDSNQFNRIRIFERDFVPGGNWHYSDETAGKVNIAQGATDNWWKGDYEPSGEGSKKVVHKINGSNALEKERIAHRLPKPIWKTLRANTPNPQQQIPGFSWPPGLEWASHHSALSRYLRSFASWLGINTGDDTNAVVYNTRVESITKRYVRGKHHGWTLLLREYVKTQDAYEETYWTEDFDAVVIASGRFNVPHIPAIPGLTEWQSRFPDNIQHSREYRDAETIKGKNVVVVGASASATGISVDINAWVNKSYLSVRASSDDPRAPIGRATSLSLVPPNTTIIGEIGVFHPILPEEGFKQGKIELLDGTIITDIDQIIFGTGYRYAFPFLSQYHNTSSSRDGEDHPIVTDGFYVENLHLDVFYIDQPTIAFQGQNVGIQTFVYGKYVGQAIASVWSGRAHIPSKATMRQIFSDVVERRGGLKKGFQWLNGQENDRMLQYFVAWLNQAALESGGKLLETPRNVYIHSEAAWYELMDSEPRR
ncbi:hypothetical protein BCR39DRAFT_470728 [Naematelia encephala]|uniref:FAD/NAD(P)-binding domain-containing protein n=1 Tax=Naematelia encephala TaxID=71784 RepID=A0A1Y2AVT9_9TREE|nr:hypothetical protein BCR39DRAFT_470728 [Naematelia encephala]